jgi:hypothetical protein
MGPVAHTAVAALTAAAFVAAHAPPEGAVAAFCAGTLIDADHLVDYLLVEGPRFDLTSLRTGAYFRKAGRALVLLHSYELVIAGAFAAAVCGYPWMSAGIMAGAATHLVCDVCYYRFDPRCYSLVYRMLRGFALDAFKRKPITGGNLGA